MSRNFQDFNDFSFSGSHRSHRSGSSSRRRTSSAARDPFDVSGATAAFSNFSFNEPRSSGRRHSSTHRDPYDSSYSRMSAGGPPLSYDRYSGGGSSSGRRSSSSRHGYSSAGYSSDYSSGYSSGYGSGSSSLRPPPLPTDSGRFSRRDGIDYSNNAADFYDPFAGALGTGSRTTSWTDPSLPTYRSASAYAREQYDAPRYSSSHGHTSRTSVTDPPPYRSFDSRYGDAPMQYPPTRRPSHYGGGSSSSRSYDYYYDKYR